MEFIQALCKNTLLYIGYLKLPFNSVFIDRDLNSTKTLIMTNVTKKNCVVMFSLFIEQKKLENDTCIILHFYKQIMFCDKTCYSVIIIYLQ